EIEKLTHEQQKIIREAAALAKKEAWENLIRQVEKNYAEMKSHGMTITESVSPEFHAFLQDSGKAVVEDWLKSVGPMGQEILDKYAAARASRRSLLESLSRSVPGDTPDSAQAIARRSS